MQIDWYLSLPVYPNWEIPLGKSNIILMTEQAFTLLSESDRRKQSYDNKFMPFIFKFFLNPRNTIEDVHLNQIHSIVLWLWDLRNEKSKDSEQIWWTTHQISYFLKEPTSVKRSFRFPKLENSKLRLQKKVTKDLSMYCTSISMPRKEYKSLTVKNKSYERFLRAVREAKKRNKAIDNSAFLNLLVKHRKAR